MCAINHQPSCNYQRLCGHGDFDDDSERKKERERERERERDGDELATDAWSQRVCSGTGWCGSCLPTCLADASSPHPRSPHLTSPSCTCIRPHPTHIDHPTSPYRIPTHISVMHCLPLPCMTGRVPAPMLRAVSRVCPPAWRALELVFWCPLARLSQVATEMCSLVRLLSTRVDRWRASGV